MRIWSFLFAKPEWALSSARVAAKSKFEACLLMQPVVPYVTLAAPSPGAANSRPAKDVILQYAGDDKREKTARILSVVTRKGIALDGTGAKL